MAAKQSTPLTPGTAIQKIIVHGIQIYTVRNRIRRS
jgi:hypothetical protein